MENTQKSNQLIAEFMGATIDGNTGMVLLREWHDNHKFFKPEDLKYHISWDWLMPVVEKIERSDDKFHVVIFDQDCMVYEFFGEEELPILEAEGATKLEATYSAVIQFITWYNSTHIPMIDNQQDREKWVVVNVNDNILVKLKDSGYQILADDHNQYVGSIPDWKTRTAEYFKEKSDEEGFYTFHMWEFMKIFGPHISMLTKPQFETDIKVRASLSAEGQGEHSFYCDKEDHFGGKHRCAKQCYVCTDLNLSQETAYNKKEKDMILDIFEIVANDDRKQWEFTPRIEGYTSYTVSYSECSSRADACIAVWKSLQKQPASPVTDKKEMR